MYGGVTNVSRSAVINASTAVGAAVAMAFASNPTVGPGATALICIIRSTSNTITSLTDNGTTPATWVRDNTQSNGTIAIDIWRANALTLPSAGLLTVTCNNSGTRIGFFGLAYTGLRYGPPSFTGNNSGTGTAQLLGATPAGAGALYFGGIGNQTVSAAEVQTNHNPMYSMYVISNNGSANGWGAAAFDTVDPANTSISRTLGMDTGDSVAFVGVSACYETNPPVPPSSLITTLPTWIPGFPYRDTDMMSSWAQVAAMMQHNVVFRGIQTKNADSLPSNGAITNVHLDTILEDPFGGWSGSGNAWSPPAGMTGWFEVSWTVNIVSPGAQQPVLGATIGSPLNFADLAMQCGGFNVPNCSSGTWMFPMIGGQTNCGFLARLLNCTAAVNTSLVAGQQSHGEITWWTIQ